MEIQKQKVLEAIDNKKCRYFYEVMQEDFTKIPGMPIAYWISENTREIFSQNTLKEIASPC